MIRLRPRTARKRHPIEGGARTIRSSRRPLRAFTHTAQKWGQNNSFKWGHYCPSKTVHDRRADDDGVCCRVGARAVSAAPVNHDVNGGRCREDGALHMGDESDRAGADVLGEEDVREGKPLVESVVAHGRRSLTGLLGGLGDEEDGSAPVSSAARQGLGGAHQHGGVRVVSAGVHDPSMVDAYGRPESSVTGSASMSARTSTVRPGPFASTPTLPVPPTPSRAVDAFGTERRADPGGGPVFGSRQLRMRVQLPVEVMGGGGVVGGRQFEGGPGEVRGRFSGVLRMVSGRGCSCRPRLL